jgi:hypothetical protein
MIVAHDPGDCYADDLEGYPCDECGECGACVADDDGNEHPHYQNCSLWGYYVPDDRQE